MSNKCPYCGSKQLMYSRAGLVICLNCKSQLVALPDEEQLEELTEQLVRQEELTKTPPPCVPLPENVVDLATYKMKKQLEKKLRRSKLL